jgi:hypothetical protein
MTITEVTFQPVRLLVGYKLVRMLTGKKPITLRGLATLMLLREFDLTFKWGDKS